MKDFSLAKLATVTVVGSSATGFVFISLMDASIKSFLLIGIASVVCANLVRASAATRHLVWASTLAGVLAMPAFGLLMPEFKILPNWLSVENRLMQSPVAGITGARDVSVSEMGPSAVNVLPVVNGLDLPIVNQVNNARSSMPGSTVDISAEPFELSLDANLLLALWALGFVVCMLPIAFSFVRLKRIEQAYRPFEELDARVSQAASRIAQEIGMRLPQIIVGPIGSMPMVWSIGRARLLLPAESGEWSETKLHSVLLHELVHLRRHDPMIFVMGLVARAANWFNPLVWYAVRCLRAECERACDDHVIQMGIEADEYAGHLLELAAQQRSAFGTGTLAMGMATKPKIENRIVSILDQRLNRCGVTRGRTMAMLVSVTIGAAALAALAAHPSTNTRLEVVSTPIMADDEIKWPHCVVEIEDLKPRTLKEAVAQFNQQSKKSPIGSKQPPITEQETREAIAQSVTLDHVSKEVKSVLREIAKTGQVPANAYFRRFTRFDDEREFHGIWWVRLVIDVPDQLIYSVPVRTTRILSRPYTQMERQQNSEPGVSLINRFSSYFEGDPKFGTPKVIDQNAASRLIAKTEKALAAKSLDDLRKLFLFKNASKSTRDFVDRELTTLIDSTVHSIQVSPRNFDGKLIHWSAFQHYKPTLSVIGYLDVVFTPEAEKAAGRKRISFELGKFGQNLRLVNYEADGDMQLPKGAASHSMRGNNEQHADGTFLLTTTITNPGTLLSAHLANEEVWQRDFNNVRAAANIENVLKNMKNDKSSEKSPAEDDNTFTTWRAEDEKSERLVLLFQKLGVKAKLRSSSHARDIPDLYKPCLEEPSRFVPRDQTFVIHHNPGIKFDPRMEHIWFSSATHKNRFYVYHRFHWNNPNHDRVFGPFEGSPFAILPEIEANMLDGLASSDSNPAIIMRRMIRVKHDGLTARVLNLIDKGLDIELKISDKNTVVKSFEEVLEIGKDQISSNKSFEEKVTSINKRLSYFQDELDRLTLEFPESNYTTAANSSVAMPEKFPKELWGNAVNGLRFAAVPDSTTLKLDDEVTVTLIIENVGMEEDIKISVRDLVQDVRPEVSYNGERVEAKNIWYSGWRPSRRYILEPGDRIALAQSKLTAISEESKAEWKNGFGVTGIPVSKEIIDSEDTMKVQYRLEIGAREAWSRGIDGVMRIYSPAKGEWRGSLLTAPFKVSFIQ